VTVRYDNYPKERLDGYRGDVFGRPEEFQSPHWLYRRFHNNLCKALTITRLESYSLRFEDGFEGEIEYEISGISEMYDLRTLALHNALVLMVSAVETYLRDSFATVLSVVLPEKAQGTTVFKILKRHSFQNPYAAVKAFKWLCKEFDSQQIYHSIHADKFGETVDLLPALLELLDMRNKAVHESIYFDRLDIDTINFYAQVCLYWVNQFDYFFEDNGYYEKSREPIDLAIVIT